MDEQTRSRIQNAIDSNDIVLFMKGTPQTPRCGFSATVVQILDTLGASYGSVDVLSDPAVRDGIKEFSEWPTIPQLYIRKEFVGGCDIIKEMYGSGELEEKLGLQVAEVAPPKITVTPGAAAALNAAIESDTEGVRLEISGGYEYGLSIADQQPKDIVVEAGGVKLLIDRASAKRADGTTIDFIESPQGKAFKIENPKEPPKVRQLAPKELAERRNQNAALELWDVRSAGEREIASIEGSQLLDRATQDRIMKLPKDTTLVFYCHSGGRSRQAADFFLSQGFTNVYNLAGGIDAWSVEVDPNVPRY